MSGSFRFLGTGASTGIPVIGCSCPVCSSDDPRNRRLRTSGLLTWEGKKLLIDVGPDFREQALRTPIHELDGVFLTHPHYDHIGGLDELRIFFLWRQVPLPCLLSQVTYDELKYRCGYLFAPPKKTGTLTAKIDFAVLEEKRGTTAFLGLPIQFFTVSQAGLDVTGFRFGSFAYVSDICQYPETVFDDLKGVQTLVLSALRFERSNVHLSVDEAVAFARHVRAKKTWLVHMGHELDHWAGDTYLPPEIRLAHDGLEISL